MNQPLCFLQGEDLGYHLIYRILVFMLQELAPSFARPFFRHASLAAPQSPCLLTSGKEVGPTVTHCLAVSLSLSLSTHLPVIISYPHIPHSFKLFCWLLSFNFIFSRLIISHFFHFSKYFSSSFSSLQHHWIPSILFPITSFSSANVYLKIFTHQ